MSETKLEPCPFCGPQPALPEVWRDHIGYVRVICGPCGSSTGTRPPSDPDGEAKVIAHWNRRSTSRSAILEEAAQVADEHARLHPLFNHGTQPSRAEQAVMDAAAQIAAAIRSLITHKEKGDE